MLLRRSLAEAFPLRLALPYAPVKTRFGQALRRASRAVLKKTFTRTGDLHMALRTKEE